MFALREPFVLGEAAKVEASGAISFSPTLGRNPALLPPRSPSLLALGSARSRAVPLPLGVLSPRARFGDSNVPWAWLPTCTTFAWASLRPVQGAQMSSALCRGSVAPRAAPSPAPRRAWRVVPGVQSPAPGRDAPRLPPGQAPAALLGAQGKRSITAAAEKNGDGAAGEPGESPRWGGQNPLRNVPGAEGKGWLWTPRLRSLLCAVCTGRCRLDRSPM